VRCRLLAVRRDAGTPECAQSPRALSLAPGFRELVEGPAGSQQAELGVFEGREAVATGHLVVDRECERRRDLVLPAENRFDIVCEGVGARPQALTVDAGDGAARSQPSEGEEAQNRPHATIVRGGLGSEPVVR